MPDVALVAARIQARHPTLDPLSSEFLLALQLATQPSAVVERAQAVAAEVLASSPAPTGKSKRKRPKQKADSEEEADAQRPKMTQEQWVAHIHKFSGILKGKGRSLAEVRAEQWR
jgi:hypothetical protein